MAGLVRQRDIHMDMDDPSMNAASERFFAEGARQEASGDYLESPPAERVSLDRIARSYRPPLTLLGAVLVLSTAAGLWTGAWPVPALLRSSAIWQTVGSLVR
jgi:hypothetical protein